MLPFRIYPPYYVVKSNETCWKCGCTVPVFALAASRSTAQIRGLELELPSCSPFFLTRIASIPIAFLRVAVKSGANVELRRSGGCALRHYVNVCPCGATLGDHLVFKIPGHAFFPRSLADAERVQVRRMNGPTTSALGDCRFIDRNLDLIFRKKGQILL